MGFFTEKEQMVMDLRAEGYDCFQIARKLEMTVPEVEAIVFGDYDIDPAMLEMLHWSGHHH